MRSLRYQMALCAMFVSVFGFAGCEILQKQGSPTSPTPRGGSPTLDVVVSPVSETFTAPCQKTVVLTATARGASTQPSWRWSFTGPSSASISDNGATATLIMRASGTYTVIATTQDGQASGSFSVTLDCGGPGPTGPTGFGLNTNMGCVLVSGEYAVAFGWAASSGGSYRVEYKSSRDGVWRNALELVGASINGTSFTARRVRSDYDHFFRVFSGSTLWSTPEHEAKCDKVPACRNNSDDDGDRLVDRDDPGCHVDFDLNKPYLSERDDEFNPAPTGGGPGPGPGPGPGGGSPPTGSVCTGSGAFTPFGATGKQGTSITVTITGGCSQRLTTSHPDNVRLVNNGNGTVTVTFRSPGEPSNVCNPEGACALFRTIP